MNKEEAKKVLTKVINNHRLKSYDELVLFVDNSKWIVERGESGTEYQIQIQTFIDDEKEQIIRLVASIDNRGLFSFMFPLCDDFLLNSKNEFIGE